jgi:saccharopine dehydrogenase-like NADP-dependent oxidoreductase
VGRTVLLVGLGRQGEAALFDLARQADIARIMVADNRPGLAGDLSPYPRDRVSGQVVDAADESALAALMRQADVVVEALPGPLAFPVGRLAAEVGVHLVSSMYYRDPGETDPDRVREAERRIQALHRRAAERGVVILTEFGLDPGLDLVLAAEAVRQLDEVHELRAYGAGLPAPGARDNPLAYKFSWSPIGVMRTYHRPAHVIVDGAVVTIPADRLFERGAFHLLDVPAVGSGLECFANGDAARYAELLGVRETVREMGRYTCRLPGHCAFWDAMVKSGFLDHAPVRVGDTSVSPQQFTATLLASRRDFQYADDEADLTFIRVDVRGLRNGVRRRVCYDLVDTRDFTTGLTSMQRTVGFTLSLGARLILDGALATPGLLGPLDVPYRLVFPALERHGIHVVGEETAWA